MAWDFFETLMATRQMSFEKGAITIMGGKVAIVFDMGAAETTIKAVGSKEKIGHLYNAAKKSVSESMKHINRSIPADFGEFFKWYANITMLSGWGVIELTKFDEETKTGVIYVSSAIVGVTLTDKVNEPIDHMLRGLFAGAISYSLGKDIDVIEEECVAVGAKMCKFVFKPKE